MKTPHNPLVYLTNVKDVLRMATLARRAGMDSGSLVRAIHHWDTYPITEDQAEELICELFRIHNAIRLTIHRLTDYVDPDGEPPDFDEVDDWL